eukprot:3030054-Prymnesium_polylepis.2
MTDAVIDSSAQMAYAFMQTDNFYPMQGGTGAFKVGKTGWDDYSVMLNESPRGFTGFILVLASGVGRSSPAEIYILLKNTATYIQDRGIELADAATPSQLMATPTVISSIGGPIMEEL